MVLSLNHHIVLGNEIGVQTSYLITSISPNTATGTRVATVYIIQPSSSPRDLFMRLSSYSDSTDTLIPLVFGLMPNEPAPVSVTPAKSGRYSNPGSNFIDNPTVLCTGYVKYALSIYVISPVYQQGDWIVSLDFQRTDSAYTTQIKIKGSSCAPSERFDIQRKICVPICDCGYRVSELSTACTEFGKYISLCI